MSVRKYSPRFLISQRAKLLDLVLGAVFKSSALCRLLRHPSKCHTNLLTGLNTRDPQAEIPELEAFSVSSNAFSVQYVQPRYFESQESLKKAKAQTENFNVLRRIDHDGRFKAVRLSLFSISVSIGFRSLGVVSRAVRPTKKL